MPRTDGIDVAHYQGAVDWPRVRATGAYWAGMKATQGTTFVDPMFATNRRNSAAAGFVFRLMYGWLNPVSLTSRPFASRRIESARAQAAHFLRTVGPLGVGEGAMLDAEQAGVTADMVVAWCETVEAATGRPVAVYTGAFVDSGRIWNSAAVFNGRRPRILAAYTTEANARRIAAPHAWDAWQFIGGNGRVDGVVGPCDLDQVDNPAAFIPCCGIKPPTPIFDPANGSFGTYPTRTKATLRPGESYPPPNEQKRLDCLYLQGVIFHKAGGSIALTGWMDGYTVARVKDVQRLFKLVEDGIVGPQTWTAIDYLAVH